MSTLSVATLKSLAASTPPAVQDSAGMEIGTFCRAWVNFNGTGTVAIRADFNVSSITDNGVGDYTLNFSTALDDGNYAATFGAQPVTGSTVETATLQGIVNGTPSTTSLRVRSSQNSASGAFADLPFCWVSIFR